MGRAMVREPKAFLMDEPLSNLDAKLRVAMRGELTRLHERLGVTTVYVTHDQVEAMTLGQRVAVLRDGVLQQCDTPQKLFHEPANLFVAAFMGSPSMNVVEAEVADGQISFAGIGLPLPEGSPLAGARRSVILGVRPTDLRHPEEAPAGLPRITVRPDVVEELGSVSNLLFPLDAPRVTTDATRAAIEAEGDDDTTLLADDLRARFCASVDGRREVALGEEIELAVDNQHLHFFDPDDGRGAQRRGCPAAAGSSPRQPVYAPASGGGTRSSARAGADELGLGERAADPASACSPRGSRRAPTSEAGRPARRRAGRPRCRRPRGGRRHRSCRSAR